MSRRPAFPEAPDACARSRRDWLRQGLIAVAATTVASTAAAREPPGGDEAGPGQTLGDEGRAAVDAAWRLEYESPRTERWRIGLRLETGRANCDNVLATFPVPMPWPEQSVRLVSRDIDPRVTRWSFRDLPAGARQFILVMPRVPAGSTPEVMLELDVTRWRVLGPERVDDLVIPAKATSEMRQYLGPSPYIDTGNSRLRAAARRLAEEDYDNAWGRVEAIYDFVRDSVEYVEGDIKSASQALRDGTGDCEEMTSLFVALCRLSDVPARMVWIPDHCYPEFYLEDADGKGTWFPCQAAGTRQFGGMDEYRPVLQKGDRFKVPEKRQSVRYVAEYFTCLASGGRQPHPVFVREVTEN